MTIFPLHIVVGAVLFVRKNMFHQRSGFSLTLLVLLGLLVVANGQVRQMHAERESGPGLLPRAADGTNASAAASIYSDRTGGTSPGVCTSC
jgi:hypothetical protein